MAPNNCPTSMARSTRSVLHCIAECKQQQHRGRGEMIRCILCMQWFHCKCIQQESNWSGAWTCPSCRVIAADVNQIKENVFGLRSFVIELSQCIKSNCKSCDVKTTENLTMRERIGKLEDTIDMLLQKHENTSPTCENACFKCKFTTGMRE